MLVVAAVGNHGCACDTIPASVSGVLAVGAHDEDGTPLLRSNWGANQRAQGIVAPGRDVPGACVGGGLCRASGTSFAAAVVSGVAGLLMSLDVQDGLQPSGRRIRRVLLDTSVRPQPGEVELAGTYLAGRLEVSRALEQLRVTLMPIKSREENLRTSGLPEGTDLTPSPGSGNKPDIDGPEEMSVVPINRVDGRSAVVPAHEDCGCGGSGGECSCSGAGRRGQLVYAIGGLGFSYVSEARRDSIWRVLNERRDVDQVKGKASRAKSQRAANADEGDAENGDPNRQALIALTDVALLGLLQEKPYLAPSVVWTLSNGGVPKYAVMPTGAFAIETYDWLLKRAGTRGVDFVAIPGIIAGQLVLIDGSRVDVIVPERRGMESWNTAKYVEALKSTWKAAGTDSSAAHVEREVQRFLGKIFFSIRNLGLSPRERAINAAATNAFNISEIIVEAGAEGLSFRDVAAEPSPISPPGRDCYDVLLTFFDPARRLERAPLRARLTIDVSDTVPVTLGDPVCWYEY